MTVNEAISEEAVAAFLDKHRLPDTYRAFIDDHLLPLCDRLLEKCEQSKTLTVGINGAQGTGKSTLAEFLKLALEDTGARTVAVLSLDDFYLTKAERSLLASETHELFATRGVPGTHDIPMLNACLGKLLALGPGDSCRLPRFDKAIDDRADESEWLTLSGPVDVILLEGWCVGSFAQTEGELRDPVNELERTRDPDGHWRRYVNHRLATDYAAVFAQIQMLIFLRAPGFDAIYRWRLEQEEKLAARQTTDASGIMNEDQVRSFIQHYERITRNNQDHMAELANVVLELDERHQCVSSHYRQ